MAAFSPAIREFLAAPEASRRLGPYACKEPLDEAGTAPVFRAVEEHAGHALREVAVKVFDVGKVPTKGKQPRVVEEARALCLVQHPNVIRFHSLTTDPRRGLMGIVMELAEGVTLDKELASLPDGDPGRVALAVDVGVAVASALDAAHEAGVAHCKVKASNVIQADGTYKLLNFGLASTLGEDDRDGAAQKDLTALGALLHACLTGRAPSGDVADEEALAASGAPSELVTLVGALAAKEGGPTSAASVVRALERIRSALAGHARSLPPEDRGPFPGLDRYEAADRDVFSGRSAEVAGVLELVRRRGLVGVVGLSGVGKSSITRAGILPAIADGALGGWPARYRTALVTPGSDLMAALDEALSELVGAPLESDPEAIFQQLSADVDAKGEGICVLVDQLEELVMKHDASRDAARSRAVDLLVRAAQAPAGVRFVVAVRRDMLDELFALDPNLARALSRGVHLLGPLSTAAWEEVVDQGLEAYGYRFEDDALRSDLLADLRGREAAMSLVQFGLASLWEARDAKKKRVTRAGFSAKEGMRGALERHADAAIAKLDVPKPVVRDVLLSMTTPEGTRAHADLDDLVTRHGDVAKKVVFALTKARLVVSEAEGFTFLHDVILKEWGLLRGYVEASKDDRVLVSQIERDAARWRGAKDPADHWRRGRLAAALELWKAGEATLSDDARSFLAASAKDENRAQLVRWLVGVLIVGIVMGATLVYARLAKDSAEQAKRDAEALAAALADVKTLKRQAEENAAEAETSAKLLQELQKKMADYQRKYGAEVEATMKKVANATSLEGARKASADLKAPEAPAGQVVALPSDLLGAKSPASGPKIDTSGPSPTAGGGTFDQAAIERVVNARKTGVKRTCLERSAGGAGSTRVVAALTIAPNGSVQNVSTSGNDPAVGRCIEQQLRSWSFPAPGETKQVQIPFVFVRQ